MAAEGSGGRPPGLAEARTGQADLRRDHGAHIFAMYRLDTSIRDTALISVLVWMLDHSAAEGGTGQ